MLSLARKSPLNSNSWSKHCLIMRCIIICSVELMLLRMMANSSPPIRNTR
ncbi:Uncharacterised protein [Vibrio cholerae]|nr:Uncharacterised protein [Vibrio cholerae]